MPISNEHTSIKKRQTYHDVLRGNLETVKKRKKKNYIIQKLIRAYIEISFLFSHKKVKSALRHSLYTRKKQNVAILHFFMFEQMR